MKRISVLALGPQNVYPAVDGGKEGIFGALQALAQRCAVTYAYPDTKPLPEANGYSAAGIRALPVASSLEEGFGLIVSATAKLRPYKFEKYSGSHAVSAFTSALRGQRFDAILCFHAHTAGLGRALSKTLGLDVPIIVREHNIEYELVGTYRRFLKGPASLAVLPFEMLTRREERKIWGWADSVAFLSDRDYATAAESGVSGRFILAREGVPIPERRVVTLPAAGAPLLMLFNPKASQSVVNTRDFIRNYWMDAATDPRTGNTPLVVTGVTTDKLAEIVDIDAARLSAHRVQGAGFIPDLRATLAASLASVSPTFVGGGIRKKMLEAMANQVPVIATRLDIETCSYFKPDDNVLELGDVDQLCRHISRLRNDPQFWLALCENGRATIETYASWEQFADTLLSEISARIG